MVVIRVFIAFNRRPEKFYVTYWISQICHWIRDWPTRKYFFDRKLNFIGSPEVIIVAFAYPANVRLPGVPCSTNLLIFPLPSRTDVGGSVGASFPLPIRLSGSDIGRWDDPPAPRPEPSHPANPVVTESISRFVLLCYTSSVWIRSFQNNIIIKETQVVLKD